MLNVLVIFFEDMYVLNAQMYKVCTLTNIRSISKVCLLQALPTISDLQVNVTVLKNIIPSGKL